MKGKSGYIELRIALSAVCMVFMLTSCVSIPKFSSGDKNEISGKPAVFTPKADVSKFAVDGKQLQGKYAGIYFCGDTATKFILDVSSAGSDQLSGKISRTDVKYQYNGKLLPAQTTESLFSASYDATSGSLQMRVEVSQNVRGARQNHGLGLLRGVFMPDGSGFVAINQTPLSRNCTMWVAKRGDTFPSEWGYLDAEANPKVDTGFFSGYSLKKAQKNDVGKKVCDEKLYNWIKQLESAGQFGYELQTHVTRNLYSDKYFVPHFGMPYHKMEFSDRQLYHVQFNGSCLRDPRLRQFPVGTGIYTAESFYRPSRLLDIDKTISAIAFNMIHQWQDLAQQHLENMVKNQAEPDTVAQLLAGSDTVMQLLWPSDRNQFKSYAESKQAEMLIPWLQGRLTDELAAPRNSMASLENLASFETRSKQRYPNIDSRVLADTASKVAEKVNASLEPAATNYVQSLSTLQDISTIDNWQRLFPHLSNMLNASNTIRFQDMLAQRRNEIVLSLLEKEKQNYQQSIISQGATMAALESGVAYEASFNQNYAQFADLPEFQSFATERRQAREKILEGAAPSLIQVINKQEFERNLNSVKKTYLLSLDYQNPTGQKVVSALEKRIDTIAPFRGDRTSSYFNALYSYDYEALREIDNTSFAPIKDAMGAISPQMQAMGAILEGVSGGFIPGRQIMNAGMEKLEHASLIYPIMGYYVLNYEKYNANCMHPKAKPHTIRYSWERTRTQYGYTYTVDSGESYTHYRVNPKFEHVFNKVYETQGDKTLARWADRFFKGNNKLYLDEVIDGTHNLMQLDCNTATIKKLEDNMIRYFDDAMTRQSEAVHKALSR